MVKTALRICSICLVGVEEPIETVEGYCTINYVDKESQDLSDEDATANGSKLKAKESGSDESLSFCYYLALQRAKTEKRAPRNFFMARRQARAVSPVVIKSSTNRMCLW